MTGREALSGRLDRLGRYALFPLDHYTLLAIARGATASEVERGYQAACAAVEWTPLSVLAAVVWGRSPQRLRLARDELLDPVRRAAHDAELDALRRVLCSPPF